MRTYQSVVILKPDLDEPQVDQAIEKIGSFISKFGGEIIKTEKWGKKRLAYRVKKNRFGYYLNIYHSCDGAKITELENEFKLYDLLIKFLVIRLEQDELDWALGKGSLEEVAEGESSEDNKDKAEKKEPEAAKESAPKAEKTAVAESDGDS